MSDYVFDIEQKADMSYGQWTYVNFKVITAENGSEAEQKAHELAIYLTEQAKNPTVGVSFEYRVVNLRKL